MNNVNKSNIMLMAKKTEIPVGAIKFSLGIPIDNIEDARGAFEVFPILDGLEDGKKILAILKKLISQKIKSSSNYDDAKAVYENEPNNLEALKKYIEFISSIEEIKELFKKFHQSRLHQKKSKEEGAIIDRWIELITTAEQARDFYNEAINLDDDEEKIASELWKKISIKDIKSSSNVMEARKMYKYLHFDLMKEAVNKWLELVSTIEEAMEVYNTVPIHYGFRKIIIQKLVTFFE